MTQLLFIEFFYTIWGKILLFILLLLIPFIAGCAIECKEKRRPIGSLLLLALWFFIVVFEVDIFNVVRPWITWLWLIGSVAVGIGSALVIGPQFDDVKWVDEPICYISTSALNSLLIASICFSCINDPLLPLYFGIAILFHFISCENYVMALAPLFSFTSLAIMWYSFDFSHWYMIVAFVVAVLFQFALSLVSAGTWSCERNNDDDKEVTLTVSSVLSIITFGVTLYFLHRYIPIFEFVEYYPYWSLAYIVLFLAALIQDGVAFSIFSIISTIAFVIYLWSSLYIPGLEFSLPDFSFSWPSFSFDLSWNWDLFTFTWCSVITWIGIAIVALCLFGAIAAYFEKKEEEKKRIYARLREIEEQNKILAEQLKKEKQERKEYERSQKIKKYAKTAGKIIGTLLASS